MWCNPTVGPCPPHQQPHFSATERHWAPPAIIWPLTVGPWTQLLDVQCVSHFFLHSNQSNYITLYFSLVYFWFDVFNAGILLPPLFLSTVLPLLTMRWCGSCVPQFFWIEALFCVFSRMVFFNHSDFSTSPSNSHLSVQCFGAFVVYPSQKYIIVDFEEKYWKIQCTHGLCDTLCSLRENLYRCNACMFQEESPSNQWHIEKK